MRALILISALAIIAVSGHAGHAHHDEFDDIKLATAGPTVLKDFALNEVRLTPGSPAYDGQQMSAKYLTLLDADRLLYSFMVNAKLPTNAKPIGGWEDPNSEIRGHFIGMYLSATAKAYNSYGDVAQKQKGDYMVSQLAKCQQALGGGYLSAFPSSFFDRLETLQNVWVPYYTIHKIIQGLFDMHILTGNAEAMTIVNNMATYFAGRIRNVVSKYGMDRWLQILNTEYGGWNDIMYLIYAQTHNPDHLYIAQMFDMAAFLGPLGKNQDILSGLHVNQHIPIVLGATERYEILNDAQSRTIAENFWNMVYYSHSYATGGTSGGNGTDGAVDEHWGNPNKIANTLTNNNQETCTTYNMLKLLKHLIQWSAKIEYFDHYEKAYFNGILGTQNLQSVPGTYIYSYPMGTGWSKKTSEHGWGDQYNTFWCCYGSSVIQWAKMGEGIYFRSNDDSQLYVNLFVPSVLKWSSKNITITQTTGFPVQQGTTLTVNIPHADTVTFGVNVHVPYWVVAADASIFVNGVKQNIAIKSASFVTINRAWKNSDVIDVQLPMGLHAAPTPDNPKVVAVMYGPLVLGGLTNIRYTLPISDLNQLSTIITSAGSPLRFNMKVIGGPGSVTLVPLYTLVDEVYGVYWRTQ